MDNKFVNTMRIFDSYERRFAQARAKRTEVFSADEEHRAGILKNVKHMLGWRDELVPVVHGVEEINREEYEGYSVTELRYQTWENCWSAATLTMPEGEDKVPLVVLFNGHTKNGRWADNNRILSCRLAEMGIAVLSPDNIGQGDREFMGHRFAVEPFYHGLTLQGLIVMESVSVIRYMKGHPRIDENKIGAVGNSGGGTLTMFLAAMAPELSAIFSSGYPSEIEYILSKERRHCVCNLLPGCAHLARMWEIYSLFAPKPLFLEQGLFDDLIPVDLFYRNARKVRTVYSLFGAEENFREEVTNTKHSWECADRALIAEFFGSIFGKTPKEFDEKEFNLKEASSVEMPEGALTTRELVEQISGKSIPENINLHDIFKPTVNGKPIGELKFIDDIGRGDLVRVFAQMECALSKEW